MNTLERLRPQPQQLDPAWSSVTLQRIFASHEPPKATVRFTVRRRVLVGAASAFVAVLSVVIGSMTMGTSAAFAVEQESDGDVVVTIRRLTDPAGLEKALGERGIDASVTYLRTSVPSDLGNGSGQSPCTGSQPVGAITVDPDEGGFTVTFDRTYLDTHRGAELLLTAAGGRSADDWSGLRVEWSDGRC
jgi:hypothetical protein